MNKNKNLQSGFTLVELVVVMAIMAIIFGALMNVITPTNKFFNETEAFKDELVLSQGITDALGDEVRYSTNVVVLQNYVGVPNVADGAIAGVPDVVYDRVLLIENDEVRGAFDNNYASNKNSTVARRKGAKGQILRFEIGALGVNFNVCDMLYSEAFYDEYQYEFSATGKVDENGNGYIDFNVIMNDMVSKDGGYVANDDNYESSEFLYLKNINLDANDGYNLVVKDFKGSVDDKDYDGFERADVKSGITATTSTQQNIFDKEDSENVHTWIIYYKGSKITAGSTVTLTFDPNYTTSSGAEKPVVEKKAEIGKAFNQEPPILPDVDAAEDIYVDDAGYTYTRTFAYWTSSLDTNKHWTNADITAYIPMTDEKFTANYNEVRMSFDLVFYDKAGLTVLPNGKFDKVKHGESVEVPNVVANHDGNIIIWRDMITNAIIDEAEFSCVTQDISAYAYECKKLEVKFMKYNKEVNNTSEVELLNADVSYTGIEYTNVPAIPEIDGYTGEWATVDADGNFTPADFTNITEDTIFYPMYTAI